MRGVPTPKDKLQKIVALLNSGKSPEQAAAEVGTAVNVARRASRGVFPSTWTQGQDQDPGEVDVELKIRLPLSLATEVQAEAHRQGRSFNAEVVHLLRSAPGAGAGRPVQGGPDGGGGRPVAGARRTAAGA